MSAARAEAHLILSEAHERELRDGSSISAEVVEARGYKTVETKAELARRGFGVTQRNTPTLLLPQWDVHGAVNGYQHKPNEPRVIRGRVVKYESAAGRRPMIDVQPLVQPLLADPSIPIFPTEGSKKADAAASRGLLAPSLAGVYGWRGANDLGGLMALPDWESVALKRRGGGAREVFLTFDSDAMTKIEVYQALARLKAFLEGRGARVRVVYLPHGDNGTKTGLDDFFAAGATVDDVLRHAEDSLRQPERPIVSLPYRETAGGLVWVKQTQHGEVITPLTNFSARIIGHVLEDDGLEQRRSFHIEASLRERIIRVDVPAERLAGVDKWAIEQLGPKAIVYPGAGSGGHARAAIQMLSEECDEELVYRHVGWREVDGQWMYLTADGAIGADGKRDDVTVKLDAGLARFQLPPPPDGDDLRAAVRKSLELMVEPHAVAPQRVVAAGLGGVYRSVLGSADFGIWYVGQTGVGKTEIGALLQQHFGSEMDSRRLPAHWSSTGNALEGTLFAAKDAVCVIDNVVPNASRSENDRLMAQVQRVLQAQGDGSGRLRMRADGTLRAARPPRGLLIGTGEDMPVGHSTRARVLAVDVGRDDVRWPRVTAAQQLAAQGVYAGALAGYLRWLAPRYGDVPVRLREDVQRLRAEAHRSAVHARTPEIVANLAAGWRWFLSFALDIGAVSPNAVSELWAASWAALGEAAAAQAQHQRDAEPTRRFLDLVGQAIASGVAHVANPRGDAPVQPSAWGWRERTVGAGENARDEWQPQGKLVGWLADDGLYLLPDAALVAAQEVGERARDGLSIAAKTLAKRLDERGHLASTEKEGGHLTVRKTFSGGRQRVLHIFLDSLRPLSPEESVQSGQSPSAAAVPIWEAVA